MGCERRGDRGRSGAAGVGVAAVEHLEHVELHAALDVDLLRLARPHLLRLEHLVLHPRRHRDQPAEVREPLDLERARAVEEVRQVEVDDVVPRHQVGVALAHELGPRRQHVGLLLERDDLRARDRRARVQREHVLEDGGVLALQRHVVGDLDHRVLLRLGEDAGAPRALDVEREDAERRDPLELALRLVRDDVGEPDVELELAVRPSSRTPAEDRIEVFDRMNN